MIDKLYKLCKERDLKKTMEVYDLVYKLKYGDQLALRTTILCKIMEEYNNSLLYSRDAKEYIENYDYIVVNFNNVSKVIKTIFRLLDLPMYSCQNNTKELADLFNVLLNSQLFVACVYGNIYRIDFMISKGATTDKQLPKEYIEYKREQLLKYTKLHSDLVTFKILITLVWDMNI